MRFRFIFLLFFLAIGLVSCEPELTFSEPQPEGNFHANKFKSKFRGKYLCIGDSSILEISKTGISQHWNLKIEIDSVTKEKKDLGRLNIDTDANEIEIHANDDSTHFIVDYHKTIFEIGNEDILKYDRGIYFLNYKNSSSSWEVKIVHFLENGKLLMKELELNQKDLDALKSITEVAEEKNEDGNIEEYKIHPTKSQFNQLLSSDLFEEGKEFIRIR